MIRGEQQHTICDKDVTAIAIQQLHLLHVLQALLQETPWQLPRVTCDRNRLLSVRFVIHSCGALIRKSLARAYDLRSALSAGDMPSEAAHFRFLLLALPFAGVLVTFCCAFCHWSFLTRGLVSSMMNSCSGLVLWRGMYVGRSVHTPYGPVSGSTPLLGRSCKERVGDMLETVPKSRRLFVDEI